MCFVCGVYTAATSAAAPEGGSWDVREAARVDARPPDVAALLFASIVFGLRAEDPAAFLGRTFVMEAKLSLECIKTAFNTVRTYTKLFR